MKRSVWYGFLIVILLSLTLFAIQLVCGQEQKRPVDKPPTLRERLDIIEQSIHNEQELQHARWSKLNRQMHRILKRLNIDEEGDLEAGDRLLKGAEPPAESEEEKP